MLHVLKTYVFSTQNYYRLINWHNNVQAKKFEVVLKRKATIKKQAIRRKNRVDNLGSNEVDKELDNSTDPFDTVHTE